MNREETKGAIEIMQAWLDGAKIQERPRTGDKWHSYPKGSNPIWDWDSYEYRAVPESQEFWVNPDHGLMHENVPFGQLPATPGRNWIKVREVLD